MSQDAFAADRLGFRKLILVPPPLISSNSTDPLFLKINSNKRGADKGRQNRRAGVGQRARRLAPLLPRPPSSVQAGWGEGGGTLTRARC
jgi:hypothetical protein